uniref:L1 transposable element RRM domain-containing protein n=1 Tax=Marmota marmota marmota TaxID=9994 RepID=A0A8C6EP35_MARMA
MSSIKKQGRKGVQTMKDSLNIQEDLESAEKWSYKELKEYLRQMEWNLKEDTRQQIQTVKEHFENELHRQIKEEVKHLYQEIEIIKKNKTIILEMKETINQIKNSIESITNRVEQVEARTSDNEDKIYHLEKSLANSERLVKNHEKNIQEIWDNIKKPNLRVIGIEEGTEIQTKGMSNLLKEIITENFPEIKKETDIQIVDAYRTPSTQNHSRPTPRHIVMKISNIQNKEKILKATRERRQITFRGKPIRLTTDFSSQTLKARRSWNNVFQTLKDNGCQPRILYPAKLSFRYDNEIKIFHDKQKLKEFAARKPALQSILSKTLHEEEMKNNNQNHQWEVPL